jgi:hypothetical protein
MKLWAADVSIGYQNGLDMIGSSRWNKSKSVFDVERDLPVSLRRGRHES